MPSVMVPSPAHADNDPRTVSRPKRTEDLGRPKRVLLVEINEDGTVGGSHQALYDLATHADRSKFEPLVLFYEENRFAERLRERGLTVHVWNSERAIERNRRYRVGLPGKVHTGWKSIAAVARRFRLLIDEQVDLVHLNNSPCIGFSDWLPAARLARLPITCHSRGPYFQPSSGIGRWLTRRFDAYVAISRFIAGDLADHGTPVDRIRQVYDGIALENWKPLSAEEIHQVRAERGVADDALLVVLVGLIRSWKGQAVALEAMRQLSADVRRGLRLWIVGGNSEAEHAYFEAIRRQVVESGLEDTVAFLGHRFDVARLMGAADVVLHASTVPEPFGLVVVEGLALGKVVVASQLGGPSEVLEPGDGVLFDPAQPTQLAGILADLVHDADARIRFQERARARAQFFDVQRTVDAVADVWSNALAKGTTRNRALTGSP